MMIITFSQQMDKMKEIKWNERQFSKGILKETEVLIIIIVIIMKEWFLSQGMVQEL